MNGLHLFINNSNLFIEAQRVARNKFYYDDELVIRLRINYGSLLEKVSNQRKLMETVLVGSRPPQNDSLWKKLEELNIKPKIFDRSRFSNKEKGVDAELINSIRNTLDNNPSTGTIAIVAGDSDYFGTLKICVERNWNIEIYFWEQASRELKTLAQTNFLNLDNWFNEITYKEKERE